MNVGSILANPDPSTPVQGGPPNPWWTVGGDTGTVPAENPGEKERVSTTSPTHTYTVTRVEGVCPTVRTPNRGFSPPFSVRP